MAQIILAPNRAYPSLPTVGNDLNSHSRVLEAIIEALQIHERRTGDVLDSFVRVGELEVLGLANIDGKVVTDVSPEESTTHHHNSTYLRLDGSNDPVTGPVSFTGGLSATGLTASDPTLTGTIIVSGATFVGLSSDDLSDVASIGMLDENETVQGNWDFEGNTTFSSNVTVEDGIRIFFGSDNDFGIRESSGSLIINSVNPDTVIRFRESGVGKFLIDHGNDRVGIRDGYRLRIYNVDDTDYAEFYHDGTDFNFAFTNTADLNITGLTSIQAGSVDVDFDAVTATSYGGILEANLLDKGATETVTGNWTFSGSLVIPEAAVVAHEAALTITESQISDLGSYLTSVQDGNIDSEAATDGYVLTADGAGGAAWEASTGGSGINNVVEDTTPQLGGDLDGNGYNVFVDIGNYYQAGGTGTGHSGVFGATQNTDSAALKYSTYWAYDSYWDESNDEWVANRTTLGRKFMVEMGHHTGRIDFNYFDGTVSSPWADADWDRLVSFDGVNNRVDVFTSNGLRVYDAAGTDYGSLSHDGTDFFTVLTNTRNWDISGATSLFKLSDFIRHDFLDGLVDTRYGLSGSYADNASSGSDWGANIWGMGDAYAGSGYGTTFSNTSPGNRYGLSWIREGHSEADSLSGEGLYLYRADVFSGALGRAAWNCPTSLYVTEGLSSTEWGRLRWNTDSFYIEGDGTNSVFLRIAGFTTGALFLNGIFVRTYSSGNGEYAQLEHDGTRGIISVGVGDGNLRCNTNGQTSWETQSSSGTGLTAGLSIRAHNSGLYDAGFNILRAFNTNVSDGLEANHCGTLSRKTGTSNITLTLESSANTDFPVWGVTTIINQGTSGNYIVNEGSGTTLYYMNPGVGMVDTTGGITLGPGGVATIYRLDAANYICWGSEITYT